MDQRLPANNNNTWRNNERKEGNQQENTSKKNKHSCVANPYSHGQQFVGKTMLDIETEQEKGDLCGKLTRICLELFGRKSYLI